MSGVFFKSRLVYGFMNRGIDGVCFGVFSLCVKLFVSFFSSFVIMLVKFNRGLIIVNLFRVIVGNGGVNKIFVELDSEVIFVFWGVLVIFFNFLVDEF